MSPLLDRRLVFVTGKGGVGKSTVAVALGLLAARRGQRTLIAELAAQNRAQSALLGGDGGRRADAHEEVRLSDRLFAISIDAQPAMAEYLRAKAGPMGSLLSGSRLFQTFAMAAPGTREFLAIAKVSELVQPQRRSRSAEPYDLVIVDAPATGHGVGFLRTPRTFAEITRVGPVASQARQITEMVADRSFTGLLAVTTPEEMPVSETLALDRALSAEGLALDMVVLNALYPERFSDAEVDLLSSPTLPAGAIIRTAARAAISSTVAVRPGAPGPEAHRWDRSAAGDPAVPLLPGPWPDGARSPGRRAGWIAVNIAELLSGKRVCICGGAGGVGKDDDFSGDRPGDGRGGREGRGGDDRPGAPAGQCPRPSGARQHAPARRVVPAGRRGCAGRGAGDGRRAVGHDARLQADLRRAHRTAGPGPRAGLGDQGERIYREISSAVSGSQEYTAVSKLYELDREGDFDLLVLDTPPSRNALDFLDAPGRITSFLEGRALRVLLRPSGAGMRLIGRGTGVLMGGLKRLSGSDLVADLSVFFSLLGEMTDDFSERAHEVERLLRADSTAFVLVTSLSERRSTRRSGSVRRCSTAVCPFRGWWSTATTPTCGPPTGSAIPQRSSPIPSARTWPGGWPRTCGTTTS